MVLVLFSQQRTICPAWGFVKCWARCLGLHEKPGSLSVLGWAVLLTEETKLFTQSRKGSAKESIAGSWRLGVRLSLWVLARLSYAFSFWGIRAS